MNVYDFDNTILRGDSSALFLLYCVKKHPSVLKKAPALISYTVKFAFHAIEKQTFKQNVFSVFMPVLSDPESEIEEFWDRTCKRVKRFYKEQQRDDDTVISASPEFLIAPICARLGIKNVIATPVDIRTGIFRGKNCQGKEKPVRFSEIFPNAHVESFYSDSLSDTPMAKLAERAYLVKGEKLSPWKFR